MRIAVAAIIGAVIFGGAASALQWVDRSQAQAPSGSDGMGNNNTIYGNVKPPQNMGSGNVIVGPTDSNGNTIIRPDSGGIAIGSGAKAGPYGVSIGAGAGGKPNE